MRRFEAIHEDGRRIIRYAWWDQQLGPLLTQRDLLMRGWTKASIRREIGDPDCYGFNPRGGALVLLYREDRVWRAKVKIVG